MNQIFHDKKGFTLVELAIVMVIVGLLIGMGAGMIGPMTKRAKLLETTETLKQMKESIIGYIASRKEVPCDATEVCTAPDVRFNSLVNTRDKYNSALYYIYSGNLRTDGATNIDICGVSSANITLRICHDSACVTSNTVNNVAFIVLSRGENINKQTNGNGTMGATIVTVYDPGINNVPDGDTTDTDAGGNAINRVESYDDIYMYATLLELQGKLSCSTCVAYEVYNAPVAPADDFLNNTSGACYPSVATNLFVTSLSRGGSIERHTAPALTPCSGPLRSTITYINAVNADTNRNCQVNYTNTLLPLLTDR